jgi:molybdopterin-containing oxidoreductase family iron-sulfur binding subunit
VARTRKRWPSGATFLDDSAAWADLILPDHSALESAVAVIPAVSTGPAVTVAAPFVKPLYDTRPMEQTLADLAQKAGVPGASPAAVSPEDIYQPRLSEDLASTDVVRQGGLWLKTKPTPAVRVAALEVELGAAVFDGDAAQYPLLFQPYLSMQYHDGSGSHLPWMQELPDPASNAIWGLPVEIDAATAASLRVSNGDVVRVESQHGSIEAPAYIHPGAIPGVASMAIGDGHTHYGRYASRRGANPLSILAPVWEKSTGALVLGGTRVRLMRVADRRGWIQFAAPDREERDQHR